MERFSGKDLVTATGGRLLAGELPEEVPGISTDSRAVSPGEMFVALRGQRFDGHEFVPEAFRRGARCAVVSRKPAAAETPGRACVLLVDDTLRALGAIARAYREKFPIPLFAVTGSNGKTTTKDMLAGILSQRLETHASARSLNNEIGVPLVLLGLGRRHQAAVVEMGMNAPGEIAYLAGIARPDRGIITNIGRAHLERFGSLEAVARAKEELADAVAETGGTLILNEDDPYLQALARRSRCRVITFGFSADATFRAEQVTAGPKGTRFLLNGVESVTVNALGTHNVANALAAAAGASTLGFDLAGSAKGLDMFRLPPQRMDVREMGGIKIIDDAYNANPDSMAAALAVLSELPGQRKIAVFGTMKELGGASPDAHLELGKLAAQKGVALLIAVNEFSELVAEGARRGGMSSGSIVTSHSRAEASDYLVPLLKPGDVVLVKGSRAARMEEVAQSLVESLRSTVEAGDKQ